VNCGFKAHDCAKLKLEHLDLSAAWINFPRPKTGIKRRCPLWAETVLALRAYLVVRPAAREAAAEGLVFVTTRGRAFSYTEAGKPARAAMQTVKVHRKGFGLATLRHVFETIAGDSRDQVAVNAIMGHADQSMAATYRERIDDGRLRAVVDVVHAWLFPEGGAK
jgi:integrase